MSDSADHSRPGATRSASVPKAVIHKKILDAAEAAPNATVGKLADNVEGATADLVERVLDEYGDPAADDGDEAIDDTVAQTQQSPNDGRDEPDTAQEHRTTESMSKTEDRSTQSAEDDHSAQDVEGDRSTRGDEGDRTTRGTDVKLEQLTDRQRQILREISEAPEATQKEIADALKVSAATVSQHVNSIDGFDWARRREFVESVFEDRCQATDGSGAPAAPALADRIEELAARIEQLEAQSERLEAQLQTDASDRSALTDPDLASKLLHACMHSDRITEDEELEIVRAVLTASCAGE